MHDIRESTYLLLTFYSSTIQFHPAHSTARVHAHNYGLYQASVHTAAEPTLITTNHDSDLQTQSEYHIKNP